MAVETAQYINQLNTKLPDGGDSLSEGDNHIRLIKEAITQSFPNIDAPVTATAEELNNLLKVGVFASCTYNGKRISGDSFGISSVEWVDQTANFQPDWKFAKITFAKSLEPITPDEATDTNGDINAHAVVQVTAFANKESSTAFVCPTVVDLEPDFVIVAFYQLGTPDGVQAVVWDTGFCLTIIET